jgi:SAM-dependent methyltransferase
MNPLLLDTLLCPRCQGGLINQTSELVCQDCGQDVPVLNGIPLFTTPPTGIQPSEKLVRGPETGTPWRQANWRFLERQLARLDQQARLLDVGAGRGDFDALLSERQVISLDIYPYPEVDIVCDLTLTNPFKPGSFDAILLMNVLEHVYDTQGFIASLSRLLKPGGLLIVAIPFMVKMHQVPVDFVRLTEFSLKQLGPDHGLEVDDLEGYFDPIFFLAEGTGNLRHAYLPILNRGKRLMARLLLDSLQILAGGLKRLIGPGRALTPEGVRSLAPTGYQVVYRKIQTSSRVEKG